MDSLDEQEIYEPQFIHYQLSDLIVIYQTADQKIFTRVSDQAN